MSHYVRLQNVPNLSTMDHFITKSTWVCSCCEQVEFGKPRRTPNFAPMSSEMPVFHWTLEAVGIAPLIYNFSYITPKAFNINSDVQVS